MGIFSRRNYDNTGDYDHGTGAGTGHGHDNYGQNTGNTLGMTDRSHHGHNNFSNNDGHGITGNHHLGNRQNDHITTHGDGLLGTDRGRNNNDYTTTGGGGTGLLHNQNHNHNNYSNTTGTGGGILHNQNRNHNDHLTNTGGGGGILHNQGHNHNNHLATTGGGGGILNNHDRHHNDYSDARRDGVLQTNGHNYPHREKRSFFGRRNRDRTSSRGNRLHSTSDRHNRPHKVKRALFDMETGNFNRRPRFGQWLKMTWLDILTMAVMGGIGLGVYFADPAPSRSFPITFSNGEIVFPEFAYPLRDEIIPIWAAALMAALIPIAVILICQIRIRSFWDTNNAIIGLFYSLIAAAVFQVFIKWLIGGLRPHFLAVCNPNPDLLIAGGAGYGNIMFDRKVCQGNRNKVDDALESMPSGHSTAAWAGFLYLYYYLNAKLKVWSNYHPAFWKLIVTYAPLLGAFLITGALTIDEYHNWYDCLIGAIIGSVMATSAYRMVYASIWDFRFNHIPLTRHTPFSFGAGEAGAGGFETAVFTHAGGWGYEEAFGGAPFDAAHGLRGQVMGFNTGIHSSGHGLHHEKKHDLEHSGGLHGRQHGDRDFAHGTTGTNYRHGDRDHNLVDRSNSHHNTSGVHGTGIHGDRDLVDRNTSGVHGTGIHGDRDHNLVDRSNSHHNIAGVHGTGINQTHTHSNRDLTHNTSGVQHHNTSGVHDTSGINPTSTTPHRDYDSGVAGTGIGAGTHTTTHTNTTTAVNSGLPPSRTPTQIQQGDGRYNAGTSRSVERKALPREPEGTVRAVSGDYNRRSQGAVDGVRPVSGDYGRRN